MKRLGLLLIAIILAIPMLGQYYGRNKIKYERFNFKVYQSPHFQLYTYLNDTATIHRVLEIGEKWYSRHSLIFKDTIHFLNPIILFNNHADFQQNTVSNDIVDVGTGGFTEPLENRIVMPLGISWGRTDHVLGHELVHAFQYSMILEDSSLSIRSMMNIPLWMVEGMAEYFSLGSNDAFTSMWIRDAIATNKFPRFKDLENPRYFPYRWGQAFWAFIDGVYGEDIIPVLFKETARSGYEKAFKTVLGVKADTLAMVWKNYSVKHYAKYLDTRDTLAPGQNIITTKNGGDVNVDPVVSPNGKYLIFLSEKDVYTFNMFLADARTGKIIRKLRTRANDGHIDAADVYESAGTWSPDNKSIALVVYEHGNNALIIIDAMTGKIIREISFKQFDAFTSPAWSPDGQWIAFAAIQNSQTDLVLYNVKNGEIRRLTKDIFAQFQPSWSPSGRYLAFATDSFPGVKSPTKKFHFAYMDMKTGKITVPPIMPTANNLNPIFSKDESKIFFLSDIEGFRDLFAYDLKTKQIYKLTNLFTGICGITILSPAISIDYNTHKIYYSYYYNNHYTIHALNLDTTLYQPFNISNASNTAAILPPVDNLKHTINRNIAKDIIIFSNTPDVAIKQVPFRRKFRLEYISNTGFGVANTYRGMGVYGGVNLLFGDILGENRAFFGFSSYGQGIETLGGQLAYLNQQRRTWWGVSLTHQPYQIGYMIYSPAKIPYQNDSLLVLDAALDLTTIFSDNLTLFATYPITRTRRVEFSTDFNYFYFMHEIIHNYIYGNMFLGQNIDQLETPPGFGIGSVSGSYIEDNSYMGMTSPLQGKIFSVNSTAYYGAYRFYSADIDYRRYFRLPPITLAFRAMSSLRFGKDAENPALPEFYIAYPWYVRGYGNNTLINYMQTTGNSQIAYQMTGSQLAVFNAEIRLPFIGIDRLALIPSKWFFADLNAFFDAGLAWHTYDRIDLTNRVGTDNVHTPIYSAGISARINLFGQMIVEPYAALPLSLKGYNGISFGINLMSGW